MTAIDVDFLVVGSGAGGLSAAVTAAHLGLKVLVVEKESQYGGTTAWSGGWMWLPRNPLAVEAGIQEDIEKPLSYLRHELAEKFDEARIRAFLEAAPQMVSFFRDHTALQFIAGNAIPDFHGHTPDAALGGRSLCAATFDGRRLGQHIAQLKPPLKETTLWGMGIASGAELKHFLNATRSVTSLWYVTKLVARYGFDLLRYGRGMRLVNGNALVAALAASAFEVGVEIHTDCTVKHLLTDDEQHHKQELRGLKQGRVTGAVISSTQGDAHVHARYGVVLACGGFPHDVARKKQLLPHASTGQEHWSAASQGNTGDGLRLGESAGGVVTKHLKQAAALAPVSLAPQNDGSVVHFPHLIDRGKPGLIAVTQAGKRFTNEADSYYDFMNSLIAATPRGQCLQAWLVCDHTFVRRYGLGAVKPAPMPLRKMLRNGYLKRGENLKELAAICGINAENLQSTVHNYNQMALQGKDTEFAKGETAYNQMQGDADMGHANPCMAALAQGPFYAVRVVAGSLGTFAGLKVNGHAQVLNAQDEAIVGLYASGNDMASVMGGYYPSGGITLGPAMTFGYVAAQHAAKVKVNQHSMMDIKET